MTTTITRTPSIFQAQDLKNHQGDVATNAAVQALRQNALASFGNDPETYIIPSFQTSAFEDLVLLISPDTQSVALFRVDHSGDDLRATCVILKHDSPNETLEFNEDSPIFHNPSELQEWIENGGFEHLKLNYHPENTSEENAQLNQDDFNAKDDLKTINLLHGLCIHNNLLNNKQKSQIEALLTQHINGYEKTHSGYNPTFFTHLLQLLNAAV